MDDRFPEALLHRPHVVLGMRLSPFCLWHHFRLEHLGNPLADLQIPKDFTEFATAVFICSRRRRDSLMPSALWLLWAAIRFSGKRFEAERVKLAIYLRDFFACPEVMETQGAQTIETPFQIFTVAYLMRYGHLDREDAWMMPFGEARVMTLGISEANGAKINLLTEAHREALREAGYSGY